MSETVGVIGLGRMGLPITERLFAADYSVHVFDLVDARMKLAASAGATAFSSARELAFAAEILITVLPGPQEFGAVMLGPDGALDAMRPGSCWLDLTSNDPRVATEAARVATERGAMSAGAPMRGGVAEATAGTLGFYFGGSDAAFDRMAPLLATLGDPSLLARVGPNVADGHTAKLLANLLWFGQAVAATEALLLGKALSLDVSTLRTVLGNSPGGSAFIDHHLGALLAGTTSSRSASTGSSKNSTPSPTSLARPARRSSCPASSRGCTGMRSTGLGRLTANCWRQSCWRSRPGRGSARSRRTDHETDPADRTGVPRAHRTDARVVDDLLP